MTDLLELTNLIARAEAKGAHVEVEYDQKALPEEGRTVPLSLTVTGLRGCGPGEMSPIAAAERLRELV